MYTSLNQQMWSKEDSITDGEKTKYAIVLNTLLTLKVLQVFLPLEILYSFISCWDVICEFHNKILPILLLIEEEAHNCETISIFFYSLTYKVTWTGSMKLDSLCSDNFESIIPNFDIMRALGKFQIPVSFWKKKQKQQIVYFCTINQ